MNHVKKNRTANIPFIEILLFITSFLLFVFPNSFREIKLPFILLLFLLSVPQIKKIDKKVFIFYFLSLLITVIYLIVGSQSSLNYSDALQQVIIVYIITPLLWIIILNYCFEKFKIKTILKVLNIMMIFGCLSVFVGVWLYNNNRIDLLLYIMENPNMTISDNGIIELKLHVYGALIFFISGFSQIYNHYNNKLWYFLILILCIITVFISGRSALLLSLFLGIFFYISSKNITSWIKYLLLGLIGLVFINFILLSFGISIENIILQFNEKISGGGGKVRNEQAKALFEGINLNIFGAGHGIGVDYIRSYKYPWRYEYLPLAMIYRVSIIGLIIYSLPFIYSTYKFFTLKYKNLYDNYMYAGYLILIIMTFTNPYLESFEFNIFYVLPFIYFIKRDKIEFS